MVGGAGGGQLIMWQIRRGPRGFLRALAAPGDAAVTLDSAEICRKLANNAARSVFATGTLAVT